MSLEILEKKQLNSGRMYTFKDEVGISKLLVTTRSGTEELVGVLFTEDKNEDKNGNVNFDIGYIIALAKSSDVVDYVYTGSFPLTQTNSKEHRHMVFPKELRVSDFVYDLITEED